MTLNAKLAWSALPNADDVSTDLGCLSWGFAAGGSMAPPPLLATPVNSVERFAGAEATIPTARPTQLAAPVLPAG